MCSLPPNPPKSLSLSSSFDRSLKRPGTEKDLFVVYAHNSGLSQHATAEG